MKEKNDFYFFIPVLQIVVFIVSALFVFGSCGGMLSGRTCDMQKNIQFIGYTIIYSLPIFPLISFIKNKKRKYIMTFFVSFVIPLFLFLSGLLPVSW